MASLDDVVVLLRAILEELQEANSNSVQLAENVAIFNDTVDQISAQIERTIDSVGISELDGSEHTLMTRITRMENNLKSISSRASLTEYWLEKIFKQLNHE